MAGAPSPTILASLLLVIISAATLAGAKNPGNLMGLKKEKLSHFRFYWHDTLSGPNPTSIQVVNPASNASNTGFGLMNMLDNPLTVGPDVRSKVVGKAQGFYASAAQKEVGLLMAMNFVFTAGKYNGSTVTFLGRNAPLDKVREMPVIGGTGLLRFARGYAKLTTYSFDMKTKDVVVLYDVYVLHY